jgi:ATP-dependent helicase HrpA
LVDQGRRLLAEALAKGEARHVAVKNDRVPIEEIRESWRRSGGKTPRLSLEELTAIYERQLAEQNVRSYSDFRHARFSIDADTILPRREREQYMALPDFVDIRGREIPIRYDVEESPAGSRGIARLNLPEKIARTMTEAELPALDRPLRFMVTRGARGAARADTLDALRDELDRPFTDEELAQLDRTMSRKRDGHEEKRRGPRTPYVDSRPARRGGGRPRGPKRGRKRR